jgi:tRNA(fMet)-specific endonuclease VapC
VTGQDRRGLLDTSTVINLPRLTGEQGLPEEPLISTITLAELSVGPLVASSEPERADRQAVLQQAESDFEPLPFDAPAARAFGRVAASLRRAGRKPRARAYDALIAAVAVANDLPLHTCNPADSPGSTACASSRCRFPEPEHHPALRSTSNAGANAVSSWA